MFLHILPASTSVLVQDWSKIMAYQGYYGAKVVDLIWNKLKEEKIVGTVPGGTIIFMFLVAAFLGFAASREAKFKYRRDRKEITDKTETDPFLRRILY